MFHRILHLCLFAALLIPMGCNDDDLPFNDCFREPDGDENLNLTILEGPDVTLPSKVSVFFKVQDDNGNPVGYLTPDNFIIYEKGLNDECHRQISTSEAKRKISGREQVFNHTTMLVLDLSGSVLEDNLEPLKNAAIDFIDAIMPDTVDDSTTMGIWWFDGEDVLHTLVPVTTSKNTLIAGVVSIDVNISNDSSTDLYGAVIKAANEAQSILASNQTGDIIAAASVVIFTDGTDRANRYLRATAQEAVNSTPPDITFFTIGVGSEINASDLASFGRNGFVSSSDVSQLTQIFENVALLVGSEANSYYLFEYCSPIRSGTDNGLIIEAFVNGSNGARFGSLKTTFDATGFGGGCNL